MTKTRRFVISSTLALTALVLQSINVGMSAKAVLNGEVCSSNVHKLTTEINWYKSLNKAEDEAGREGKLIVWVHMLGKIDGST
ncbi:hypothetical protein BH11CYA1_BH11CYA1_09200 [soil metagenome]